MEQVTNTIPLGIKALTAKIKLINKIRVYFPEEIERYEEIFGKDVWNKQIKEYNEELLGTNIEAGDMQWTKKENGEKYNKLEKKYLSIIQEKYDPGFEEKGEV